MKRFIKYLNASMVIPALTLVGALVFFQKDKISAADLASIVIASIGVGISLNAQRYVKYFERPVVGMGDCVVEKKKDLAFNFTNRGKHPAIDIKFLARYINKDATLQTALVEEEIVNRLDQEQVRTFRLRTDDSFQFSEDFHVVLQVEYTDALETSSSFASVHWYSYEFKNNELVEMRVTDKLKIENYFEREGISLKQGM